MITRSVVENTRFNKIIIDITSRCNLNCQVCYMGSKIEKRDLPIEEITILAHKYRNKVISICGGEPTLRDDLPEIINLFNKNNTVFLVTNGLRLADYHYLKKLQKSGLRYISFSFNGFCDEAYQKINGTHLRDIKLEALANIKKARVKVILSVLIVRGINENQIAGILDYCVKNRDFIEELRIRSMVACGNYLPCEKYNVSELLSLICENAGIQNKDILNEIRLQKNINTVFKREVFKFMACSLSFHLKGIKGDKLISVGRKLDANKPGDLVRQSIVRTGFETLRAYGIKMILKGIFKIFLKYEKLPWAHSRNILKIGLRSWPDSYEFDSGEFKECQTAYYVNGGLTPFCYAHAQKIGDEFEVNTHV